MGSSHPTAQLLSTRCSAPCSLRHWPLPWSCSSRCQPPTAPTPSPSPLAPPPSFHSLPLSPPPSPLSQSWASRPSSLEATFSPGEARGLLRRRTSALRLLLTLRLRPATRG